MILEELRKCGLCPRKCGVNRLEDKKGYCKAGSVTEVFRYGPHNGEEPPVSGTRGSGTIFFSRCTLKCIYCQNHVWSHGGEGEQYPRERLMQAFAELHEAGCHNWNLVSPTPWLPMIWEAMEKLKERNISLPVVYNTSGYERVETIERYSGKIDVFLPDLRYSLEGSAKEGSDAGDYPEVARNALKSMHRLKGALKTDDAGIAVSGVICRILVLPGRAREAVENIRWLAENFGNDIAISVMSQYVPAGEAKNKTGWDHCIRQDEYDLVRQAVEDAGLTNGWMQDYETKTEQELIGFNMKKGSFKR